MRKHSAWAVVFCWLAAVTIQHSKADETEADAATRMTLSARAVESPLMKYRLLPAEHELRDGNAAPILLRLPWEQTLYFTKVVPTFQEHLELSLDDPKLLESGEVLGDGFYGELRRAAFRRTATWEYPIFEEPAAYVLLPDVQGARQIAGRGLSVRIRYHIAKGEIEQAREEILVGLAVSRHYSRTPFVVVQLVGAALDSMMLQRVEELIAHPDCPNLYWALTALPRPLIDLGPAFELEQQILEMSVAGLDDLGALQGEQQWRDVADALHRHYAYIGGIKQPTDEEAAELYGRIVELARAQPSQWMPGGAERVAEMSDVEVRVRWLLFNHRAQTNEIAALTSLEPIAAIPALADLQQRLADYRGETGLASLFVMEKPLNIYLTARGVQRRIDALRAIEAVRNFAAAHDGKLPASLAEVEDTPAPNDILTGKSFVYELADGVATLSAPGIPVEGKEVGALQYRIDLR